MKSVAALTILAGSAAAFAPAPVSRVESSLNYAAELDNMVGTGIETGNKVVSIFIVDFENKSALVPLGAGFPFDAREPFAAFTVLNSSLQHLSVLGMTH